MVWTSLKLFWKFYFGQTETDQTDHLKDGLDKGVPSGHFYKRMEIQGIGGVGKIFVRKVK